MQKHFKNPHFRRWFWYAPLGLSLFAFGLCLAIEIAFMKHNGAAFWTWFSWGTLALIITNAGLSFLVDAGQNKVFYDLEMKKQKEAARRN